MPKRPQGEKRPADVIGAVVNVMQIATGEEVDEREPDKATNAAAELGKRGGAARARSLRSEQRVGSPRRQPQNGGRTAQNKICIILVDFAETLP